MKGELILTSVCTLTITDPNERHQRVGNVELLGVLQGAREGLEITYSPPAASCVPVPAKSSRSCKKQAESAVIIEVLDLGAIDPAKSPALNCSWRMRAKARLASC